MNEEFLIKSIYDAAYEVRRHLAPGYLESIYKKALVLELKARGLHTETEVPLNVKYKDNIVGEFRADIVVENQIIIELKAVNTLLKAHELQLINYLTSTGFETGFLINYGSEDYAIRLKSRTYRPKN